MNFTLLAIRQCMLYGHLIAFAFALVLIAQKEFAIFRGQRIDPERLQSSALFIVRILGVLWITGIALILLDSGLNFANIATNGKLMSKFTVVTALTFNGLLLHWVAFPLLTNPQRYPKIAATVCSILGAVSAASWIYAGFIGTARIIAANMNYTSFIAGYIASLAIAITVALIIVRPRLERNIAILPDRGYIEFSDIKLHR